MDTTLVSPISVQRSLSNEKSVVIVSPVEMAVYFPDEKIFVGVAEGMEVYTPPVVVAPFLPAEYSDKELPERAQQIPFWRRDFSWLLAGVALLIIMITIIVGLILSSKSSNGI